MIIQFPIDRARKTNYSFEYIIQHADEHEDRGTISVDAPNIMVAQTLIRDKIQLLPGTTLLLNPVK
jgi:hypothetical protein